MKIFALLGSLVLAAEVLAQPFNKAAISPAYGLPVHYDQQSLAYPDFSIRYIRKTDLDGSTAKNPKRYDFEVTRGKGERVTSLTFTMSGYYDPVRFFDIDGKRFAAEMFYSTAEQPIPLENPPKRDGRLPHDQIVIWDEASAKSRNQHLHSIWEKEPKK